MSDDVSYPYRYERTATSAELQDRWADLEPGAESGTQARLAGRIMTMRSQGKVAFADLQDASGRIQLFGQHGVLGDEGMRSFSKLSVGDIVGADGEVMRTRRGELSLRVADVTLLAECRRPMPEKWHGVTDVESRYRQRYLDLLLNETPRRAIEGRAAANEAIRSFFAERRFIEVETPLLQPIASGAVARPFKTHLNALDIDLYLRIAPELFLKRLLIGGYERVFELNRSFRNEGIDSRHNPEFTMLEAYEAYVDYNDTMSLVEDLTRAIAQAVNGSLTVESGDRTIDLSKPFARVTMFEAIQAATGTDLLPVWEDDDPKSVRTMEEEADRLTGEKSAEGTGSKARALLHIFDQTTERGLADPTFVTGFPKEVSPLAKDHRTIPGFTEHADLIIGGVEIAPVYSELNDPDEQRRRFEQQAAARAAGDEEAALADQDFLNALAYGMPPAGGFGFGIDRFLSFLLGAGTLREVIIFPTLRPEA